MGIIQRDMSAEFDGSRAIWYYNEIVRSQQSKMEQDKMSAVLDSTKGIYIDGNGHGSDESHDAQSEKSQKQPKQGQRKATSGATKSSQVRGIAN